MVQVKRARRTSFSPSHLLLFCFSASSLLLLAHRRPLFFFARRHGVALYCIVLHYIVIFRRSERSVVMKCIHQIALHQIIANCTVTNCIIANCIIALLHCSALQCIATIHCSALHCIALHCIALRCVTSHYIALHHIAVHYSTLHCIALRRSWSCWSRAAPRTRSSTCSHHNDVEMIHMCRHHDATRGHEDPQLHV